MRCRQPTLPDQIKGLDGHHQANVDLSDPLDRIGMAGRFLANTGALIRHGGSSAYYAAAKDYIQMPLLDSFVDEASYVAVLSHEMTHWTSTPARLHRDLSRYAKDRTERAREELIAELGSAFLCADLGITPELEPRPDHASYIDGWLHVLRGDKRAIFQAAAHAQRAVDYLHHLVPDDNVNVPRYDGATGQRDCRSIGLYVQDWDDVLGF